MSNGGNEMPKERCLSRPIYKIGMHVKLYSFPQNCHVDIRMMLDQDSWRLYSHLMDAFGQVSRIIEFRHHTPLCDF